MLKMKLINHYYYYYYIFNTTIGYDPLDTSYLCRILHAAAHFDLLSETSDDKYSLTSISPYLTASHSKSLKGFVKLYSGT